MSTSLKHETSRYKKLKKESRKKLNAKKLNNISGGGGSTHPNVVTGTTAT